MEKEAFNYTISSDDRINATADFGGFQSNHDN